MHTACCVFPYHQSPNGSSTADNPHQRLVEHGWDVLVKLLQDCRRQQQHAASTMLDVDTLTDETADTRPIFFKDLTPLSEAECALYQDNPFAAYLDGCSVVINHADRRSPYLADLCHDLQQSFPHAYCNTYLTPPGTQTVPAHADDRDVLILQVVGEKHWTVYQRIPIPYPYPHEQVGKDPSLPVPQHVLDGPVLLDVILKPGDVLYMPRGYVHEAQSPALSTTTPNVPSFHVTVALATHDWTLGGLLSTASQQLWMNVIDYRLAVPREFGRTEWNDIPLDDRDQLQSRIDMAIELLRHNVTARSVHETLHVKLARHNERAQAARAAALRGDQADSGWDKALAAPCGILPSLVPVGPAAARRVQGSTVVRAATDQEKAQALEELPAGRRRHGLQVSPTYYDAIISILLKLKGEPSLTCRVSELRELCTTGSAKGSICDLTLLCFARQCVEQGALAIVQV